MAHRESKILFHEPESAAKHISSTIDDIYGWWHSNEVQSARELFCKLYANTSDNCQDEWLKFFKEFEKKN